MARGGPPPTRPAPAPPVALVSGEAGVGKTALVESVLAGCGATVRRGTGNPWYPAAYGLLDQALPARDPRAVRAALGADPVVLFLDDLHWSDEASLDLLPALADAVVDDPVALIGVYRSDELPRRHLLRRVRAGLRHARRVHELAVEPLPVQAGRW